MAWRTTAAFRVFLLASGLVVGTAYAGEPVAPEEGSEKRAEKGDLTEINKQLTNPVSELWSTVTVQ